MSYLRYHFTIFLCLLFLQHQAQNICADSVFTYEYLTKSADQERLDKPVILVNNKQVIVNSSHPSILLPTGYMQTGIIQLNEDGNVIKSVLPKTSEQNSLDIWNSLLPTSDSGFIALANNFGVGNESVVIKFNTLLQVEWAKVIKSVYRLGVHAFHVDANDNIYLGYLENGFTSTQHYICLNKFGLTQWTTTFNNDETRRSGGGTMAVLQDKLVVVNATMNEIRNGNTLVKRYPGITIRLINKHTGEALQKLYYQIDYPSLLNTSNNDGFFMHEGVMYIPALDINQSSFLLSFNERSNTKPKIFPFIIDVNADILWHKKINVPQDMTLYGVRYSLFTDYKTNFGIIGGMLGNIFSLMDTSGNVIQRKQLTETHRIRKVNYNVEKTALSIFAEEVLTPMESRYFQTSVPLYNNFTNNCIEDSYPFYINEEASLTRTEETFETTNANISIEDIVITTEDFTFNTQVLCKTINVCNNLAVIGDTILCTGKTYTFAAEKNIDCSRKILWRFNEDVAALNSYTDNSITLQFNASFKGYVYAYLEGCTIIDSIFINVHSPIQSFSMGNNIPVCVGQTVELSAPEGYSKYEWSTGDTTATISVAIIGNYTVTVWDDCGNNQQSSVTVVEPETIPVLNDINDIVICNQQTIEISVPDVYTKYLWSTGAITNSIAINQPGLYTIQVFGTCDNITATTNINVKTNPIESFHVLNDTMICPGDVITFKEDNIFNYTWTGANFKKTGTTVEIYPYEQTTYTINAIDTNGCAWQNKPTVYMKPDCLTKIIFPNAFTPNGDSYNDVFKPKVWGQLEYYRLTIYNRWGQLVFSSNNADRGWDGRLSGNVLPTANYVWISEYEFLNQNRVQQRGNILLIR